MKDGSFSLVIYSKYEVSEFSKFIVGFLHYHGFGEGAVFGRQKFLLVPGIVLAAEGSRGNVSVSYKLLCILLYGPLRVSIEMLVM